MTHRLPHIPRPDKSEQQKSRKNFSKQSAGLRKLLQQGNLLKSDVNVQQTISASEADKTYCRIIALVPEIEREIEEIPVESLESECRDREFQANTRSGIRAAFAAAFLMGIGGASLGTISCAGSQAQVEAKAATKDPEVLKGGNIFEVDDKKSALKELAEELGFDSVKKLQDEYYCEVIELEGEGYGVQYELWELEDEEEEEDEPEEDEMLTKGDLEFEADSEEDVLEQLAEHLEFDSVEKLKEEYYCEVVKKTDKGDKYWALFEKWEDEKTLEGTIDIKAQSEEEAEQKLSKEFGFTSIEAMKKEYVCGVSEVSANLYEAYFLSKKIAKQERRKMIEYTNMMLKHMRKLVEEYHEKYGKRYAIYSFHKHLKAILEEETWERFSLNFRANMEEGESMEAMAKRDTEKLIDWCLKKSKLLEDETTIKEVNKAYKKSWDSLKRALGGFGYSDSESEPLEESDDHDEAREYPESEAETSEDTVEPQNPASTDEEDPNLPPLVGLDGSTETNEDENSEEKPELHPKDLKRLIKITQRKIFFLNRILKNYKKRFGKREKFPNFESTMQAGIKRNEQELKTLQRGKLGETSTPLLDNLYQYDSIDKTACLEAHSYITMIGGIIKLLTNDEVEKMKTRAKKNCSKHK